MRDIERRCCTIMWLAMIYDPYYLFILTQLSIIILLVGNRNVLLLSGPALAILIYKYVIGEKLGERYTPGDGDDLRVTKITTTMPRIYYTVDLDGEHSMILEMEQAAHMYGYL